MIAIRAGCVLTPFEEIHDVTILIRDEKIRDIVSSAEIDNQPGFILIDASDLIIAPGFMDLHAHGGAGASVVDGTKESLDTISKYYAQHGVTGYLPSVFGMKEDIERGITAIVDYLQDEPHLPGAQILGIHIEGPFINKAKGGAFNIDSILESDMQLLKRFLDLGKGKIRMVTLAPEIEGGLDLVRYARSRGVICSAGHTKATYEQLSDAIDVGVTHACHTFNAMPQLHHREPSVLGAVLVDDRVTAEMIVDGIHLHPAIVKLLVRAKKVDGAVLITDSISAAGMPDGVIEIEGQQVFIQKGSARLADGTLAGSVLTMDQGMRNLVNFGAATVQEALQTASTNPACVIGMEKDKGTIKSGKDADLVALDDQLEVVWTIVKGEVVYHKDLSD